MNRKLVTFLAFLALALPASATVLSFDFSGDKSGDPPLRYVGRGFLDRQAFRYDYEEGNHALFHEKMSIRSADGGAILAVIDNTEGTYFYRATRNMSGMISTYRAPWEKSIENVSVKLETLGRDEPMGDLKVSRIRLTVSYRILMDAEGEKLHADVEGVADLSVVPKYRNPALPWGHQFALKTGWAEVDDQIADKITKLGFPIRQDVSVTRTIEGGAEITERATFNVTRLREVAFSVAGFSAPAGYRFKEPTFAGPSITDTGSEYTEPGPLADQPPVATAEAGTTPALPIEVVDPRTAPPLFVETMEVRVVNVDVVVRDKNGKPVTGLTPDDFTIRENGQPVEITNFLEVTSATGSLETAEGETPAATAPEAEPAPGQADVVRRGRRKIVLYLDQNTLQPLNRKTLIPAIKDFITNALRPGDEVMIASFQNGLKVDLQFTSNRDVALEIIDRMAERTPIGQSRSQRLAAAQKALYDNVIDYQARDEMPPYDVGVGDSRTYADSVKHETNLAIGSLEALMKGLQAIEGRKLLVFATEALPSRPGNEIFIFFNEIKDLYAGGANQSPLSEGLQYDLSSRIDALADTANATGFTLYPVQAATLSSGFNSADVSGNLAFNFNNATFGAADAQRASDIEGLQTIARLTGGTLSLATNDFSKAFGSILEDLDHFYSIGYRAGGERSDFVRSIKVDMKDKAFVARTRRSHVDRSIETEMEEIVAANLFYPIDRNDMAIKASASEPKATGELDNVSLTLSVEIPTQSMTLIPQDEEVHGSFTLFIGFVRADGSVSKIARESRQFKFPAATMPRRKSITMALEVTMDQSTDRISVGVLDPISKATGFASVFIEPQADVAGVVGR